MKSTALLQKEAYKNRVTTIAGKYTLNPLQLKTEKKEVPLQMRQNPLQVLSNNQHPLQLVSEKKEQHNNNPLQLTGNKTGLPDNLKIGVEALSGYSMDDVSVHYNSNKPAQLQALAYAQGTDIHVAPGREKHLPHEAWHVVQQKQERVKPTMQMKGKVNINDNAELEKEADSMGVKALQFVNKQTMPNVQKMIIDNSPVKQFKASGHIANGSIQNQNIIQLNVIPGQAGQHDWNAKHVPRSVKTWAATAQATVRDQYETTLSALASNPMNNGDGMLSYLNGWNHKRFGGQYCILYQWNARQDGNGFFLNVKGIGRKNGTGNNYSLV